MFYEFLFYLTIPFVIYWANRFSSRTVQLFVLYVSTFIIAFALSLGSPYMLFFAGLALASFSDDELKKFCAPIPEWLLIGFYLLITATYSASLLNMDSFIYAFAIVMSLMIIKATFEDGILSRIFTYLPLRKLGRISYSFYLVHVIVIVSYFFTLNTYFPQLSGKLLPIVSLPVVFLLSVAAAFGLYSITEHFYFTAIANHRKPSDLLNSAIKKNVAVGSRTGFLI